MTRWAERPPGVGKTHLAQAIGYEAIKMNFQVLYRSIFDLDRDFMKDEAFNQRDKTLRRYLNPEFLIIDDFGLKQLPRSSGEHVFEVIMHRYENRSSRQSPRHELFKRPVLGSRKPVYNASQVAGFEVIGDSNSIASMRSSSSCYLSFIPKHLHQY